MNLLRALLLPVQGFRHLVSNQLTVVKPMLFTVGYEGRTVADLLATLAEVDVQRLVDVRELPLSRRPGFSKRVLSESLAEVGIEYVHIRPLGNPKTNRDRYRAGDVAGGAEVYRRLLMSGSNSALVELATSLGSQPSCLLCVELDHNTCHREALAEALRELRPELHVTHL